MSHFTHLNTTVRVTPLAEHTRQCRCLALQSGQCLLWRVSSLPMLVEAGAGLPTGMGCRGSCPDHASISLIRVNENLCVKFSSHHVKIKGCNCWQWPGLTCGKSAFLSISMFGSWPCSYWSSCPNCQRAPCDGYNPPQLPALSYSRTHCDNGLLWVDHECLSGGTRLSCPSTPQPSSHPWSLLECHRVSFSVSWVWGPWACTFRVA